jgi:hypothetical protein
MWLTETKNALMHDRAMTFLMACALPLLAAFVQSSWLVLVERTHGYQALITGPFECYYPVWWILGLQALIGIAVFRLVRRFLILQRVVALRVLVGCLYYDCFEVIRAVPG